MAASKVSAIVFVYICIVSLMLRVEGVLTKVGCSEGESTANPVAIEQGKLAWQSFANVPAGIAVSMKIFVQAARGNKLQVSLCRGDVSAGICLFEQGRSIVKVGKSKKEDGTTWIKVKFPSPVVIEQDQMYYWQIKALKGSVNMFLNYTPTGCDWSNGFSAEDMSMVAVYPQPFISYSLDYAPKCPEGMSCAT